MVGCHNPDLEASSSDLEDLVLFYDISTIAGYLMPDPIFTYILNIYL